MTSSKILKPMAAKETKSSVVLSWLIKQLNGEYRYIVAAFIMNTSMLLRILLVNHSTYFIMVPRNITGCKSLPCAMFPWLWAVFLDQRRLVLYPGHLANISTLCHTYVSYNTGWYLTYVKCIKSNWNKTRELFSRWIHCYRTKCLTCHSLECGYANRYADIFQILKNEHFQKVSD